jgi:hypothetical protein
MSSVSISLNTDGDGFVSQECPNCHRRFKVIFAQGTGKPLSFCPYCRHTGRDCWWTQQQADYISSVVAHEVIDPQLRDLADELNRGGGGFIKASLELDSDGAQAPPPEDDLVLEMHTFSCCDERIKHEPAPRLYCVICGAASG